MLVVDKTGYSLNDNGDFATSEKKLAMNKIFSKFAAALGAVGLLGSTGAAGAHSFSNAGEARTYLLQHPDGPRAEAAFRLIVEESLTQKYPEFTLRSLSDGSATAISPEPGTSRAAILRALSELSDATPTRRNIVGNTSNEQVY